MSKVNYWSMKDVELIELIKERKLDVDVVNFNRKNGIGALEIDDVKTGESTKLVVIDDEEQIEEVDKKVEMVKVRFHNVRENDPPYIFLGHNGKAYYVPKDEDIYVPKFLLDSVVKDAVEEHAIPVTKDGKIHMIPKMVQRFPYTIVTESE